MVINGDNNNWIIILVNDGDDNAEFKCTSALKMLSQFTNKTTINLHLSYSYIRDEYLIHCVPSNISSGLASLPLDYVYTNGTADITKPTTKILPTGEVLDGRKTYSLLVGSYTTNNMTAEEIYDLGIEMTDRLYPQVRWW